jgi:hypothetical protein
MSFSIDRALRSWDGTGGHGFLLDHGTYTTLDGPGATYTQAYGISDSAQIVGYTTMQAADTVFSPLPCPNPHTSAVRLAGGPGLK